MAYRVIDPAGKAYALEAEMTLTEEKNGMVKIETNIEPTKNNRKFIKEINEFWTIEGVKASTYGPFHIKHLQKVGVGDWPTLQVQAIAHFIHVLQTTTMDGYYTGSRTANDFFNILSDQSGITIRPVDFKTAFGWEKFGLGVHNIKEFNRGLNNYGYTYKPVAPDIIELYDNIGRDVQYMIKNAFNSDDMKMEIDTSETFTYVEGYADFDEEGDFYETARLYDDYKHPTLFPLLGKWQAETYTNQKINQPETLRKYLKNIVDNSIKYTITASFHKIKNYPFAVPELGDRIRVQDDAINLDDTAEAVQIKTFYDKYGDVIDYEIDFGNLPIGQRVKASLESVQSQIDAIRSGRDPVNLGMLDANVAAVINSFKDSETEVQFGNYNGFQGLFLVDPNDPNKATALFSKGIGITNNGFAGGIDNNMALTHDGLNISTVYTGTLWLENFLGIIGRNNLMEMTADHLRAENASDSNKFSEFSPDGLTTSGSLKILRDDHYTDSSGKQFGVYMQDGIINAGADIQRNRFTHPDMISFSGQRYYLNNTSGAVDTTYTVETFYTEHKNKTIMVGVGLNFETPTSTGSNRALVEIVDINTGDIVSSLSVFLRASEGTQWKNLIFDIGVPDYTSNIAYYIRLGSTLRSDNQNQLSMIINRVSTKA